MNKHRFALYLGMAILLIAMTGIPKESQFSDRRANITQNGSTLIVGRNVNMVSGQEFGTGDPYLQRQNEPSIAVSTRNPMHLLAGANDYRTIDIPFEDEVPGYEYGSQAYDKDAWLGIFKSYDGGQSWISTLFPGFPQDTSEDGMYSPLKAFGTAADPVVRAGPNGTFYYAGIAFDRVDRGSGVVFVGRFIDLNNKENGDTIVYDGVSIVDQGNSGQFLDKPWLAVDLPRAGFQSQSLFRGQSESIPCGNLYVAYSAFIGKTDNNVRSKMLFSRSTDCGHTWSTPIKIDESSHIDQGAVIAIDPNDGTVYVAWRRFTHPSQPSAIMIAKSTDGGLTFTKPAVVQTLDLSFPPSQDGPFDQRTTTLSFRTNSHPAMAVDNNHVVYLAYAERGLDMRSRIVMTYSTDSGATWVTPSIPVDDSGDGHEFMPSLTFAGGKLMLTWYDQRNDISMDYLPECNPANPEFVEDNPCRHTIDVRVAQIDPVSSSSLTSFARSSSLSSSPSKQVSRYLHSYETDENGNPVEDEEGYVNLIQYQYNFSGLPLFQIGTVPFMGDYIDIAPSPLFLPPGASGVSSSTSSSGWTYNTDPSQYTLYHITWADNRDVWIPVLADGITPDLWAEHWWSDPYNAPGTGCSNETTAGILNQNVYTSCISPGFVAGSPGNTKPLYLENNPTDTNGFPIPRAFTITVKNMTDLEKLYELNIEAPSGVIASFVQYFDIDPDAEFPNWPDGFPDYGPLLVAASAHSTISQPVFVYTADDPQASLRVHVEELDTQQTSIVILNPDPTNPEIEDPYDYTGPNIKGYEVHDPNIKGTVVTTYTDKNFLLNPNIKGADLINADTAAPNIKGPNIKGPNIKGNPLNPNIKGTDVAAPNIKGTSISEISWEIENEGNTTTPYTFDIYTDYSPNPNIPEEEAVQFLLLIYKVYTTPAAEGCDLIEEEHHELIANIPSPNIKGPNIKGTPETATRSASNSASDAKSATFYLKPRVIEHGGKKIKEKVVAKLYAFDPVVGDGDEFDPGTSEEPNANAAVISEANNTEDLENGNYIPPGDSSALFIGNEYFESGEIGQTYTAGLRAYGGSGTYTSWSVISGGLPSGLAIDNPGVGIYRIHGDPETVGVSNFTLQVMDSEGQTADKDFSITIFPAGGQGDLTITTEELPPGIADGTSGCGYYPATSLSATGGTPPYTWSTPEGGFPPGMTLNTVGDIAGVPEFDPNLTYPYTYEFLVEVSDAGSFGRKFLSISVDLPPLGIGTPGLPDGVLGQVYTADLVADCAFGTLTWSIVAGEGTLPPGLSLDPVTGVISGTPDLDEASYPETYGFTVEVSDPAGSSGGTRTASMPLGITIAKPLEITTPSFLPYGVAGAPYTPYTLSATGGIQPYQWPPGPLGGTGLNIDASGIISGTPTTVGVHQGVNVEVFDSASPQQLASKLFNIVIHESAPSGDLVSWWPSDNNALDYIDGNHGTLYEDTTYAGGMFGDAFSFDGEDDYVLATGTGINNLDVLTMEMWVKLNSLPDDIDRFVTIAPADYPKAVLRHDGQTSIGQLHF